MSNKKVYKYNAWAHNRVEYPFVIYLYTDISFEYYVIFSNKKSQQFIGLNC